MITLTHVTKQYTTKKAVNDISLSTKKGEIIGFLGPNGAGKTTTMKLILGLLKPTSGEVMVDNFDPVKQRLSVVSKVGYLPENNPLYGEMRVIEYLEFIASAKGVGFESIPDIMAEVNLEDAEQAKIENLSRGYKQRVGMAAALIGNPEILILDEPTSGLDPIEQDKIKDLIKKLAKEKIVIFSTHILSEVEAVANRLIIINKGNIVYDGAKPKGTGAVEKLFKQLLR
ncbi:hypothetical protein BH09PAT2_BH09PAT2_10910 [soil metagenome]